MTSHVAVTSYGLNKNHDDEIKKTNRRPIIAPAIAVRLLIKKTKNMKNCNILSPKTPKIDLLTFN